MHPYMLSIHPNSLNIHGDESLYIHIKEWLISYKRRRKNYLHIFFKRLVSSKETWYFSSPQFLLHSTVFSTHLWTMFPFILCCSPSFAWFTLSPSIPPWNILPISSCTYVFILAQQEIFKSLFERGIAQCITGWVDCRVDVTQPVADRPNRIWDTGLAEGWYQHHDVVRGPRNDERQEDGKNSLGYLWRMSRKEKEKGT